MRIIIPGGSGLIGRTLIPALVAAGNEVWVLSRRRQARTPVGAKIAVWDGKTSAGWLHLVDGESAIINLAGENLGSSLWTAEKKRRNLSSRQLAGQAIVEAVQQARTKPRFVLQSSAIGCYGSSETQTFDETSPFGGDELSMICVAWEASTQPVEEFGVRRIVARTGLFLNKNEGVLPKLMLPFNLFAGGPLGSGRQWYSWIHPVDFTNAVLRFLEDESTSGIYNITAPQPVSMAEFGRTLAVVMRRPYYFPVPGFALRLVLGEMSVMVLKGQRVLPRRLLDLGFKFRYDQLHGALEDVIKK